MHCPEPLGGEGEEGEDMLKIIDIAYSMRIHL